MATEVIYNKFIYKTNNKKSLLMKKNLHNTKL